MYIDVNTLLRYLLTKGQRIIRIRKEIQTSVSSVSTLSKNRLSLTAFDDPAARYRGFVQSWEEKQEKVQNS